MPPRNSLWLLLLLLLVVFASAPAAAEKQELQPLLLSTTLNGIELDEPQLFAIDSQDHVYVSARTLRLCHIRLTTQPQLRFEGEDYYLVDPSLRINAALSKLDQSISLTAPADLFEKQSKDFNNFSPLPMTRPAKGGFLNYDIFVERTNRDTAISGAFEVGIFSPAGVGTTNFTAHMSGGKRDITRLETTWTLDVPAKMTSFRLGDGISNGNLSAVPVRFAGVQYGTNFATRPGFVTMPLPIASGSAALPSVVDVYVNNILQGSREVAPGPFDIRGIPMQSGGGNMQLVIHDLLGREIVTSQSFYTSHLLLRKGLQSFNYDVGLIRKNFGIASNNYRGWVATGNHHYGLTDRLTVEVIAQATRSTQVAGGGLTATLGNLGLLNASGTFSSSPLGTGHSFAVGLERRAYGPSVGVRTELTSRDFTHIGFLKGERTPRTSTQAFVDAPLLGGNIGFNVIHRSYRLEPDESLFGVFASANLKGAGSLQFFARRSSLGRRETVLGMHLGIPLGGRRSGSTNFEYRQGKVIGTVAVQQDPPVGEGFGYRASATAGAVNNIDALASLNRSTASWTLEASRVNKNLGIRASVAGSLGMVGNEIFASRRIGESFAAVQVPDLPGVRVYADNQLVGKTNKSGRLIIPSLRAYDQNEIRIDDADFPLDVQVERTELMVRPFARAGSLIKFAARFERGAILKVRLEDGRDLPAGAMVYANGSRTGYVTAAGGEVYVPNIVGRTSLEAHWDQHSCRFEVFMPKNDDPQPWIDGLTCKTGGNYAAR
ncbi:MAG: putative outer rane usher transrane protein [Alphaproteobacteria bacterium]|nr:putative outer rane usher transrane protein [Alphaproteobacteria bacterium]